MVGQYLERDTVILHYSSVDDVGDFPRFRCFSTCKYRDSRGEFIANQNGYVSSVLDNVVVSDDFIVNLPAQQREEATSTDSDRSNSKALR